MKNPKFKVKDIEVMSILDKIKSKPSNSSFYEAKKVLSYNYR